MGGGGFATVLPPHERRTFYLPTDLERNAVGFLRYLQASFRHGWKNYECDCLPQHRRGIGASVPCRGGRVSPTHACVAIVLTASALQTFARLGWKPTFSGSVCQE